MSSQRGNVKKTGPPKHKNNTAFKNTLHDTSKQIKQLNSMKITGCCEKCKEVLEWKIKYKKYKVLSQPKTCVRCHQKNIKRSYFIFCDDCIKAHNKCGKCGKDKDDFISLQPCRETHENDKFEHQIQIDLQNLSERQRRSFFRNQEKGNFEKLKKLEKQLNKFEDDDDFISDNSDSITK